MKTTLLKKDDYKRMPWKNGLGTTTQILIDPPQSSIAENFNWRLSSADVATNGLFSTYLGYDRFLTVLDGQGFNLKIQDKVLEIKKHEVIKFSGDAIVNCELIDGKITDLNFIFKSDFKNVHFKIFKSSQNFNLTKGNFIITSLTGSLQISIDDKSTQFVDIFETFVLNSDENFLIKISTDSEFALIKIIS
ncbi:MAG: HutD family protein [Bdellovibrio sp.]|nr:HutD family protein [Bdellovibrio sp.]